MTDPSQPHRLRPVLVVALLFVATMAAWAGAATAQPAGAASAWHVDGAPYRMVMRLATPRLGCPIDAARFYLDTMGLGADHGGGNISVTDNAGNRLKANVHPVNVPGKPGRLYRVVFQVPEGATGEDLFMAYFGGPAVEPTTFSPATGGLRLSTGPMPEGRERRYDEGDFRDLAKRFRPAHTGPRDKIDDVENPFGDNLWFMSVYKGNLDLSTPGAWWIAANSDDTCMVELGGKTVLLREKPGFSDAGPNHPIGNRWTLRKQITVGNAPGADYKPGVHTLVFYHLQLSRGGDKPWTVARLGWQRPEADRFEIVPPEAFVDILDAQVEALHRKGVGELPYLSAEPLPTLHFNDRKTLYGLRLDYLGVNRPRQVVFAGPDGKTVGPAGSTLIVSEPGWHEATMTLVDGRTVKKLVHAAEHRPVRRFLELSPRPVNPVVFHGQPVTVAVRLRNVSDRYNLAGRIELTIPGADPIPLRPAVKVRPAGCATVTPPGAGDDPSTPIRMQFDGEAYVEMTVTAPAETVASIESADVVARFYHGPVEVASAKVLLRTAGKAPRELTLADGRPVSQGQPVVFLETKRTRQEAARAESLRRVLVVGNLLGNTDGVVDGLKHGLQKAAGREVALTVLTEGTDTVLEDLPKLLKTTVEPGTLAVLGYGQKDMQMGTPVGDFEGALSIMVDALVDRGATVVLVTPTPRPDSRRQSLEFATAVKKVGLKRNVPVVDLYSYLALKPHLSGLYRRGNTAYLTPQGEGAAQLTAFVVRRIRDRLR